MDIDTLSKAVADAFASVALVQARTTNRDQVQKLFVRYAAALKTEPGHEAGAALVAEMARVVGEIADHE